VGGGIAGAVATAKLWRRKTVPPHQTIQFWIDGHRVDAILHSPRSRLTFEPTPSQQNFVPAESLAARLLKSEEPSASATAPAWRHPSVHKRPVLNRLRCLAQYVFIKYHFDF